MMRFIEISLHSSTLFTRKHFQMGLEPESSGSICTQSEEYRITLRQPCTYGDYTLDILEICHTTTTESTNTLECYVSFTYSNVYILFLVRKVNGVYLEKLQLESMYVTAF